MHLSHSKTTFAIFLVMIIAFSYELRFFISIQSIDQINPYPNTSTQCMQNDLLTHVISSYSCDGCTPDGNHRPPLFHCEYSNIDYNKFQADLWHVFEKMDRIKWIKDGSISDAVLLYQRKKYFYRACYFSLIFIDTAIMWNCEIDVS